MNLKYVTLILSFFYISVCGVQAQQHYTMSGDSEDNFGDDLYERSMDVKTAGTTPEISKDSNFIANYHKRKVEKLVWERKSNLLQQANRQLEIEISRRKFEERINQRRHHYDKTLADAWVKSQTGKRDGRLWHDLMEEEKEMYRNRYLDFYGKNKAPQKVESFEPEGFFIPENDYAAAWQANARRIGDGRNWRELAESDRSSFRKGYRNHQLGMYYLAKSMDTIPFYQATEKEVDLALLR